MPLLIEPEDGAKLKGKEARPVFSWSSAGELKDDEYYVLTIIYPHKDGDLYPFEQTWTKEISWGGGPDQHLEWFLYDGAVLAGSPERRWYVVVKHKPTDTEVGEWSEERTFTWEKTGDGDGGDKDGDDGGGEDPPPR